MPKVYEVFDDEAVDDVLPEKRIGVTRDFTGDADAYERGDFPQGLPEIAVYDRAPAAAFRVRKELGETRCL